MTDTPKQRKVRWITPALMETATLELKARAAKRRAGEVPVYISSIQMANRLGVFPAHKHESRKRRIRELMQALFADGVYVLSSPKGYYLPASDADWAQAENYAKANGLGQVKRSHELRTNQQRAEDAGQMSLGDVLDQGPRVS